MDSRWAKGQSAQSGRRPGSPYSAGPPAPVSEFRFKAAESLQEGLSRIALAETSAAEQALHALETDPDRAVHEIRKHGKRLRGMVRLVRDAVGPTEYHRVNRGLRDMARMFAPARDSRIRVDVLDTLRADPVVPADLGDELEGLRDALATDHAHHADLISSSRLVSASALVGLSEARRRVLAWQVPDSVDSIRTGLRRTYRRGARQLAAALEGPQTGRAAGFHTWRKRAKYLRYQLELLAPAWPAVLDGTADELHRLTDLLGDANDATQLADSPALAEGGRRSAAELLTTLAAARRDRLWKQALGLGRRLYAEPPVAFTNRIAEYTAAWRDPARSPKHI